MEELNKTLDGDYLATNGKTARRVESPDAPLDPGWRLLTVAEFEAHVDDITEQGMLIVLAESAQRN